MTTNDNQTNNAQPCSESAHSDQEAHAPNDSSDALRRDALARNLCARICDDRRSLFDLQRLDCKLTELERETDPLDDARTDQFHRFDLGGESG